MNHDMLKKASISLCLAYTLSACQSDWRNGIVNDPATTAQQSISFQTTVVSSEQATRSDASIVNLKETWLPASTERTYVRAEVESDGTVSTTTSKATYTAGLFGYYMGQKASTDFTGIAGDQPVPDLMFNQQATIGAATFDGEGHLLQPNTLEYEPLRFWPNNTLTTNPSQHERCTFWAYYPWNETGTPALYGIEINSEDINQGRLNFVMSSDASQHVDFLMSDIVTDCNKDNHPLRPNDDGTGYEPTPVQLRMHHMLAQVRLYAFVRGADKMVYKDDNADGRPDPADETWVAAQPTGTTIADEYGNIYTKLSNGDMRPTTQQEKFGVTEFPDMSAAEFAVLGLRVPDETECKRWDRTDTWDVTHRRRRADINYKLEFNNIHTRCTFSTTYDTDRRKTIFSSTTPRSLGNVTVSHYIMNPYWFRFDEKGQRVMLNDNYMYGFFEDTPAYGNGTTADAAYANGTTTLAADGINWSTYGGGTSNIMGYPLTDENLDHTGLSSNHYNYPPGNIILAVPQEMNDEDVPNIVITAYGKGAQNGTPANMSGRVTVNLLNMGLKWESGFIYSYAFIENDLRPDDDKVRGPESITVIFDQDKWGSQW